MPVLIGIKESRGKGSCPRGRKVSAVMAPTLATLGHTHPLSWAFTPPFPPATFPLLSLLGWGRDFPPAVAIPSSSLPPSLPTSLLPSFPPCLSVSLPPSLTPQSFNSPSWTQAGSLSQQVPSRPDPNPPLDKAKPVQFSSALASPAQPLPPHSTPTNIHLSIIQSLCLY